jgi:hypothetical protein
VDIAAFLIARLREEEDQWTLRKQEPDRRRFAERRLIDCAKRKQQIKGYTAQPSPGRLHALQRLALVHYDHPDYKDEWWPSGVER